MNMPQYKIFFVVACWLLTSTAYGQKIFSESFEDSTATKPASWHYKGQISIDTSQARSGKRSLRVDENTTLIYENLLKEPGLIQFSIKTLGAGSWTIEVAISTSADFENQDVWRKIESFSTSLAGYDQAFQSKSVQLNTLDRVFVRLKLEKTGSSTLFLDDVQVSLISEEARQVIKSQQEEEKRRKQRQLDYMMLRKNENYATASRLIDGYKATYIARIKTLAMLYEKSNVIEIVSGTATALGDLNQLSNPLQYPKFREIETEILPKLDMLEQAYYQDQVKSKWETFFEKIENPLNVVGGIADVASGGGFSKIVDGFKSLITQGYSTERLTSRNIKKTDLENEQRKGLNLYKEAEKFLAVAEDQNQVSLNLNKNIYSIYVEGNQLNSEILEFFVSYMEAGQIYTTEDVLVELSKNQNYGAFNDKVAAYFQSILGDKTEVDIVRIERQVKELDLYFQKIDGFINKYDRLANRLSSFYADFRSEIKLENNPFAAIGPREGTQWANGVSGVMSTLKGVETKFQESYTNVDFKK